MPEFVGLFLPTLVPKIGTYDILLVIIIKITSISIIIILIVTGSPSCLNWVDGQ